MTSSFQTNGRLAALIILLVISGCSDPPTDPATEEPKVDHSGFTANVSGSVNGEVSGKGIVIYLPPKERVPVTGIRPGYFLIGNLNADRTKEGGFIITFRIPDGAQPGNYNLTTPDPLKVGENFDVLVETVEEGKSISYQTNTEGTITLDNFSPDRTGTDISNITGTFQFVTENIDGDQISANGTFDFLLGKKVVSQNTVYALKDVSRA